MKAKSNKKLSYKQQYIKEFGVTPEEYEKIYDVYRLRVRRYEKLTGEKKINAAASLFFTAKMQKAGRELTPKKLAILKTPASSKKITQEKKDKFLLDYIFERFRGLIFNTDIGYQIYNSLKLTPLQKLEKLTEYAAKLQAQRNLARQKARERYDDELPFDEDVGDSSGYDISFDMTMI